MNQQLLVIDDSKTIHPLVTAILSDEALDVHSATDPEYGMVLAASIRPDLILLDVDMPGMNGFEVCQRLKADLTTAVCPIIFLTSHAALAEKVRGFGLGAVDYVTKPFNRVELIARVRASLRTSRVIRQLGAKAMIDPLTGLGNRAMFNQRIEAEIGLRARVQTPLSLIMMDVDHFKEINDIHGHAAGDQVLQRIGKIIAELCRREDVACRAGGEEFVLITPHTPADDAVVFAGRIREALTTTNFKPEGAVAPLLEGDCIRLTASFGVAEASGPFDRSMLERADQAMYRAKQAGRNCIVKASNAIEAQSSAA